jgi:type IV secretory pathway VirJ component
MSMWKFVVAAAGAASLALSAPSAPSRTAPSRLTQLPLTVMPAAGAGDTLTVFYSGDGGWVAADAGMSDAFVRAGIPVVGVNSLTYFIARKSPDVAAADLTLVLRHYMGAWGKSRIVLGGYSFGAGALPLIIPKLPADLRGRIRLVALVDPEKAGELKIWPGDWLNITAADAAPILPAMEQMKGLPMVCIYGSEEPNAACAALPRGLARSVRVPGGHHYGGDYGAVGRAILAALPR